MNAYGKPALELVAVGKIKGGSRFLQAGMDEFVKRLQPYCKLTLTEVAEVSPSATKTEAQAKAQEGQSLLAHLKRASYRVVLSEHGQLYNSPELAQQLSKRHPAWQNSLASNQNPPVGGMGTVPSGPMIWVIGGPLGLDEAVLAQAHWVVSLSPLTYPHQWVRLLWLEQLYRSFRLLHGEPYHK